MMCIPASGEGCLQHPRSESALTKATPTQRFAREAGWVCLNLLSR
jgi:hypothetical protein